VKQHLEPVKTVRCGIYTRKSTEEGLQQEFNSLDAQRESAEAYIRSQQHEGWVCLPTRYDDGGYTGANTDRPALKRLLADVEAGKVDCVVLYNVGRLSRRLLGFGRLMETFDQHGVSFVSVTQAFNTASSMGRLMLNVLLSFAQFERELISERTRDKMSAARKKGKYVGGAPLLGYDVEASKLIVNEAEAVRVRQIFQWYLEHESMLTVLAELDRRDWTTKQWTTRKGTRRGGRTFDRNSLYNLLTNVAYVGKVRFHDQVYVGEHAGIVDPATFERVQQQLRLNNRSGGKEVRTSSGALLKGLLRCVPCGCAMSHSHSTKGTTRYRYYVCGKAQKQGRAVCPSPSIPAPEIERFVVDQIRAIGRDPTLVRATLTEARRQVDESLAELTSERRGVEDDLRRANQEIRTVVAGGGEIATPLADLQERLRVAERRLREIEEESERLQSSALDEQDAVDALQRFDPVWEMLSPRERARVIELLVERVDYHGANGTVTVTFRPTGIRSLGEEFGIEEDAA